MNFDDLGKFALHMAEIAVAEHIVLEHGLEKCAQRIEKTAKAEIGHYQDAVGPFQDWAELAESTKADRVKKGFTENDPGKRSGEMEESITHHVDGLEAYVGSNDQNLVYFEFGTSKQPPRPVLGPAVVRNKEHIKKIIGHAAVSGLFGGTKIHGSLGYDDEI
jgi:HK97 gp10 family phage protein